jgi:PhnB protein
MPKPSLSAQLDAAIDRLLAHRGEAEAPAAPAAESPEARRFYGSLSPKASAKGAESQDRLKELKAVAEDLRGLPRDDFKASLKAEIERRAHVMSSSNVAMGTAKVRAVPEGYHTVAPYLAIRGASEAIEFYKRAFGATEVMRLKMPDGKLGHAEIQIQDSRIMLSDEFPEYGTLSPQSLGGSPVHIHLYVDDARAWADRAIAAGAKVLVPVTDMDYGERHGRLEDPFGHHWAISTPIQEERAKHVRETMRTVSPYLILADGAKAIDFYKDAFGASELLRLADPEGRINHAEIRIGDSVVMLSGEALEYGRPSVETVGGSPVKIHLYVEDVDALAARAISRGAKVLRPIQDQFYGDRSGQLQDPFGIVWIVSTHIEDASNQEIERRTVAYMKERASAAASGQATAAAGETDSWRRAGFTSVTPYLAVYRAEELMAFLKTVFGATQTYLAPGTTGIMHAEVRIGNSMLMLGGSPDMTYPETPCALHYYVDDVDGIYRRALAAGATSLHEPADQEYGERGGSVKDAFGNHWYLATPLAGHSIPEGLRSVTPYLHPQHAGPVIDFMERAFGAEEIARYADDAGVIHHAKVRIGDAIIEMGEAHGPYQPMPSALYLYVPDVDATHRLAVEAGATVVRPPADQPYGVRTSWVTDAFGMHWYIASAINGTAS